MVINKCQQYGVSTYLFRKCQITYAISTHARTGESLVHNEKNDKRVGGGVKKWHLRYFVLISKNTENIPSEKKQANKQTKQKPVPAHVLLALNHVTSILAVLNRVALNQHEVIKW